MQEKNNQPPKESTEQMRSEAIDNLLQELYKMVGEKKITQLLQEMKKMENTDELFVSLISFVQYTNKFKQDGYSLSEKTFKTKEEAIQNINFLQEQGLFEKVVSIYNPVDKNFQVWFKIKAGGEKV